MREGGDVISDSLNAVISRCASSAAPIEGPLQGISVGVKDNIDIAGERTSNGTAWTRVATDDALVISRLRAAGAGLPFKLNMHEGALGTTSDNPHHGRVQNAAFPGYSPGGSSGGSATAVAAGLVDAALGTDTMGSVRLPAAFCGLVGFKPSYDAASLHGVLPLCPNLDHVGVIGREVSLVRRVAAQLWPERIPTAGTRVSLPSLRIARLDELDAVPLDAAAAAHYKQCLGALERAGVEIESRRLGLDDVTDAGVVRRAGLLVVERDAAAALDTGNLGPPTCYSEEFLAMLDYGRRADEARMSDASDRLLRAAAAFEACLGSVDLIVSPACPHAVPRIDAAPLATTADLTALANVAGCPAIAVPLSFATSGPTPSLQLIGARGRDAFVLDCAAALMSM